MDGNAIQNLIKKAYSAFNKRDIDGVLVLMDPEVHWPNGWEGGFVEGHSAVKEYWTRQWAEINPIVLPIGIQQMSDGRAEVEVQQIVKDLKGNLLADVKIKHVYTLKNGLIKAMEIMD
jgi:nuclear transport factor 2 (NTF2) superfamily protein